MARLKEPEGGWLEFQEDPVVEHERAKTRKVLVRNRITAHWLGVIRWHGPFRRYAFQPYPETIFDAKCLQTVSDKVKELQIDHEAAREVERVRIRKP